VVRGDGPPWTVDAMTASRGSAVAPRLGVAGQTEESTAAGIYGVIVSAAVLAASHAVSAVAMAGAVLVTLVIYWSAERYSRLVAERIHTRHRPGWRGVRRQLTTGWEMVTASMLPLVVLVIVRALGTDLGVATMAALACSTLLLCVAGWEMGRHGQLTGPERAVSSAVAGLFGVVLIVLKTVLH
jgi:positive regulator of sigma E activity